MIFSKYWKLLVDEDNIEFVDFYAREQIVYLAKHFLFNILFHGDLLPRIATNILIVCGSRFST